MDAVRWFSEAPEGYPGRLRLIDQTLLPTELIYLDTDDLHEIYDAIKRLVVRGAPAIGCAAALGLAAVTQKREETVPASFLAGLRADADYLASSRPTAVNLEWALKRCVAHCEKMAESGANTETLKRSLVTEAQAILAEDMELCRSIGLNGVALFGARTGVGVLTHCNAGALATSDYGTALSPIYVAQERGLAPVVFADETRPLLQGARLTAWELQRAGVDVTVICDNMAAQVMREGRIDLVIVGADRIAANGDTANKIGTYGVAILARYHHVPFYVAAPYSTIDVVLATGVQIPIEQRKPDEVSMGFGRRTAPEAAKVYNPAFDVTPNELISGIITEKGILRPPFEESVRSFMAGR